MIVGGFSLRGAEKAVFAGKAVLVLTVKRC
jgi:hypothetical protein